MSVLNDLWGSIVGILQTSGFATNGWENYVMIVVACALFYLAIKKQFEP